MITETIVMYVMLAIGGVYFLRASRHPLSQIGV